jgi:uncharacterized protein
MPDPTHDSGPWYRQFWLWFILAPPLSAVVLGLSLLTIAIVTSDSMVVGDYGKVGTAMHKYMAKEAYAAELGVHARLHLDEDGVSAVLQGWSGEPEKLHVLLSHPTQAERDLTLELTRNAVGVYRAEARGWVPGRWYVRLEPEDRQWRLTGELTGGRQELNLVPGVAVN